MTTRTDEERMERLLDDALAAGVINAEVHDRLEAFVHERAWVVEAAAPRPAGAPPAPPLGTTPPPKSMLARPYPTMPVYRPAPPRRESAPSPVSSWVGAFRKAVVSDVAVHGLAYLGVFLLFAGTLGFFLFSFGSLATSSRPWAELAIPTVLLGSAVFLRRRGAPVVATAVGIVGGVLLPVVLFASYVDSVAFPPDLQGDGLGWGVIVTSLVLACAYALVATRWRDVSVRHLVAPMLWTALFGVGILLPGAQGASLKDWTAVQFALVAFGVAATALMIRVRPSSRFSLDSTPCVVPGALVSLSLVLLLAGASGWPGWPLTLTGLAMLAGTEAFAERLGVRLTQVLQPPFLWLAAAGIGQSIGEQIAGPVLVIASLATLEWQMWRRPGGVPAFANSVGAIGGLSITLGSPTPEPWAAVAATLPIAAWAHARRMRRPSWLADGDALILVMTVAAIASTGVGAAVLAAMSDTPAFLLLGMTLVLVALATRQRRAEDIFLRWWTLGSAVLLGITVVIWPGIAHSVEALVLALSTLTVVATPGAVRTRAWLAVSGVAAASSTALLATGLNEDTTSFILAAVACGAVGVLTWSARDVVAHVSAAGWTVAVISTAVLAAFAHRISPTESNLWLLAIGMGVLTLATASAAAAFEWRHRGAALQLAHLLEASADEAAIPVLPPMLVLLGLAGTALTACDAAGLVRTQPGTVTVLLAALALVESGGTHLFVDHVTLRNAIGVGAFALGVVALLAAVPYLHASAATLALLIVLVVFLRGDTRLGIMTATAWAASGFLAFRAGQLVEVAERDLPLVVAAWAAVVGLGALRADDMFAGRRSPGMFVRTRALLAPAVFGLVTFTPALVFGMGHSSDPRIAWLSFAGAVAFAAAAILLRLGAVTVGTWIFLSVSALLWSPWSFADEPVIGVGWAAALGAVAMAFHIWEPTSKTGGEAARRWDIPPMAVGTTTTVVALGIAAQIEEIAITWTLAGALALATAFVLRSRLAAGVGAVLVVVGAIDAGHGWAALALGGAAAGLALIAVRESQPSRRIGLQVGSAVLAAGSLLETVIYAGWTEQMTCGVALVLGAAGTTAALTLATRSAENAWVLQLEWFALGFQLVGTGAAVESLPERGPLVAALLTAGALSAAIGIGLRRLEALAASPVFAGAAWLVGIGALIREDAMWWAVPAGLAAVSIAEIGRWWDRHREPLGDTKRALVGLEYAGMAALVAAPLAEIVTVSSSRAIPAVLIGLLLAGWGLLTKVRRRLFVGAGGVVVAIVLVFGGQIAKLVPKVTGAAMWVILVAIGIVLILIATSLERGRARIAAAIKRIDELFADWE